MNGVYYNNPLAFEKLDAIRERGAPTVGVSGHFLCIFSVSYRLVALFLHSVSHCAFLVSHLQQF